MISLQQLQKTLNDIEAAGLYKRERVITTPQGVEIRGQEGQEVHVIESGTAVQGIAAMAVYDPGADVRSNEMAMTRAAAGTRHGGVTVAAKPGLTTGGECQVGDALGVVAGDITIVGDDLGDVAVEVIERLAGSGSELVTLVIGEDADADLVEQTRQAACGLIGVEVEVIQGGQPAYPLLIGVE